MSRWNLRHKQRNISYYEPEEPPLDEYIFCDQCADIVYEYCAIHGPLLVVPDDKVPTKTGYPSFVPRAALTIPKTLLHLAPSIIPGAGIGVFSSVTLPKGVRFGPYRGKKEPEAHSDYCWQIYNEKHKASYVIDAVDANKSNWLRYVNCARHWCEQNLVAFQYQGQLYYRTVKIIPRFTELLVFYGSEYANYLNVDVRLFNCVSGIAKLTIATPKKRMFGQKNKKCEPVNAEIQPTPAIVDAVPKQNNEDCNNNVIINPSLVTNRTDNNDNRYKTDTSKNIHHNTDIIQKIESNSNVNKRIKLDKTNDDKKIVKKDIGKIICSTVCQYSSNYKQNKIKHEHAHTGERPYKCTECPSAFKHRQNLITHRRTHTGEKLYKCTECPSAFTTKSYLIVHKRKHTGEKPYKCTECPSAFTQLPNLTTHRRTHTGEKPYKCTECPSAFTQLQALIRHRRTHTGEKPYKCTECPSAFTDNSDLIKHRRTHTGEKPYKCTECPSAFTQLQALIRHRRTHTGEKPYKCTECPSAFTNNSDLIKHRRTHTGEKPYKCTECPSAFTNNSDLIKHRRTHTGEKPYKCTECPSAFTDNSNLIKHRRTHTGEKPNKCT